MDVMERLVMPGDDVTQDTEDSVPRPTDGCAAVCPLAPDL